MKTWADVGIEISSAATSGEVYATCPKCSHDRKKKNAKCLSANLTEGVWICHHCGWSGTLAGGDQRRDSSHWRKPRYRIPAPLPATDLPRKTVEWFAQRAIPEAILARNQIALGNVYMPQVEAEVRAVIFPFFRAGELVNRKYRDIDKNFRLEAGAERVLYGLDDIGETLVWVEGEIDKLSVEVAGITSCVSVPDGAPAENTKDYSSKFAFLDSAEEALAKVTKHVIAVDNDRPGQILEDELARRLGRGKCWRVVWPEGCKDANEALVKHGAAELRALLDHAGEFPIEGVFSAIGESPNIYSLHRHGFERGNATGWKALDDLYTVRPGEFSVVTGVPSHGKSNFLDCLTVNLAIQHGWSFAFFSPENQPLADHMARVIEKYKNKPFHEGPSLRMSEAEVGQGIEWVDQHFSWILPSDEKAWGIDWILARAQELVYRRGIRGLIIDPWNELEPNRQRYESETDYISRVLRTVRQFGRQNGVHVWLVVHPTKLYRLEDGKYPVPTLYDCAGSAHWRNKADNGLCIWRDLSEEQRTREVKVFVQKIRYRQIGKLGEMSLYYEPATATYSEIAPSTFPAEDYHQ